MIIPSSFDSVFAKHYQNHEIPIEDERELLRYYTIFASHENECSNYDVSKQVFLKSISNQLLRKYHFQTIGHMECVEITGTVKVDEPNYYNFGLTLHKAIEKAKDWHYDLLIIIFDDVLSSQYIDAMRDPETGKTAEGHYRYEGDYKQIVITTSQHSSNTSKWIAEHIPALRNLQELEEQSGAWIMSHELAHFALEYLGYPPADWVGYVHDPNFGRCITANFSYDFCSELYTEIRRVDDQGNSFWIKVMNPPYEDIKRQKELPSKTYSYTETPGTISVSTDKASYQKGDTVWINGKVNNSMTTYPVIVQIIDPSGMYLLDRDVSTNYYNEFRTSFKTDSIFMSKTGSYAVKVRNAGAVERTIYFSYTNTSEIAQPTPITPQPSQILDCDVFDCYEGKVRGSVGLLSYTVNGIKDNYENLKEGDLLCVKYFLGYNSKDLSKRYPIPYGKISQEFTALDDKRNPVSSPTKKYYTVNDSGELKICENFVVHSPSFASNGYQYRTYFEGDSKYGGDGGFHTLTFSFSNPSPKLEPAPVAPQQPTPVTPSQPKITKYDFDGDGIPDYKDTCRKTPEDYNGYIDWDGCPDQKQFLEQQEMDRNKILKGDNVHIYSVNKKTVDISVDFGRQIDVMVGLNHWQENEGPPKGLILNPSGIKIGEFDFQFTKIMGDYSNFDGSYIFSPNLAVGTYEIVVKSNSYSNGELIRSTIPTYSLKIVKSSVPSSDGFSLDKSSQKIEYSPYEQKAKQAKSIFESKIQLLYSEISKADRSHSGQFNKLAAQKKIDEVWKVREMAMNKLGQAKANMEQGYRYLGSEDYKRAYESFQKTESVADSVEEDVKWISKAIRDAKKMDESGICFLYWCFYPNDIPFSLLK